MLPGNRSEMYAMKIARMSHSYSAATIKTRGEKRFKCSGEEWRREVEGVDTSENYLHRYFYFESELLCYFNRD